MLAKNLTALLTFAGLVFLAACSSSTSSTDAQPAQTAKLFEFRDPASLAAFKATPGVARYLSALTNEPANVDIRPINVVTSLVSPDTKALTLSVDGKTTATFQLRRAEPPAPGMIGWVGDMSTDRRKRFTSASEGGFDKNWISLVLDGGDLVGSIYLDDVRYDVRPVGQGQHVLVRVDETKLPPEAEPLVDVDNVAKNSVVPNGRANPLSTIRVMFVTTNDSREQRPNAHALLAEALQAANQYMINSKVAIRYELSGYFDADISEEGKGYGGLLSSLGKTNEAFGKAAGLERDRLRADLVSMLITRPEYCGMAYVTASKGSAFSAITCVQSLAHELGHNLGATHNWEEGQPVGNPPYMYGYRYQAGTPRFSTQMSYSCSPACPRIPYHSNPRVTYEGIPVGTAAHHDVARRFNERRETVENFYPPTVNMRLLAGTRPCELTHEISSVTKVAAECEYLANKEVLVVHVFDVPEGARLTFTEGGNKWRSYRAKTFIPELFVMPVQANPEHYPNVDIKEGSEPMSGLLTTISSDMDR